MWVTQIILGVSNFAVNVEFLEIVRRYTQWHWQPEALTGKTEVAAPAGLGQLLYCLPPTTPATPLDLKVMMALRKLAAVAVMVTAPCFMIRRGATQQSMLAISIHPIMLK